jgi:16S rRNA (cytosine967-C5)-methyltransferase
MPVSPARAAAFDILLRVGREDSYASELLHSHRLSNLSTKDRGLATELVMGVLRWQSLLDRQLAAASSQKLERLDAEALVALRLGVYQLQFLSKIPARAALFESVELVKAARKRSAASFVNAVLRKTTSASGQAVFPAIEGCRPNELPAVSAHPEWLVDRWVKRYGFAAARKICAHNQRVPPTAIRIHDDSSASELSEAGIQQAPGLLLTSARLVRGGDVTKTRAYREGRVSIQDEASQLVALLVGQGKRFLDCCAAPGSKTSLVASENPRVSVVASDLHPHRARLLKSLVRRSNVNVIVADARQLPFAVHFDRILADVPCSGTGTLARNPEIKWRFQFEDLADLQSRQIAILKSALTHLTPGGRLIYSTCSLEGEENEAVVDAVLGGTTEFKLVDGRCELERLHKSGELCWPDLNSLLSGPYLRTVPGEHPCDGFFAAMIERGARPKRNYRTSKSTALPAKIFCPGRGLCVTIMLAELG